MKKLIFIFLPVILFFSMSNIVLAQYQCKCASGSEETYDTLDACQQNCEAYCLQRGGLAQCSYVGEGVKTEKLNNPLGEDVTSVPIILARVIKTFLGIVGSISLLMFIYGGFMMLTSAGAPEKIKTGQQTLVWASLGILVIFASYAMLKFVFEVIGF